MEYLFHHKDFNSYRLSVRSKWSLLCEAMLKVARFPPLLWWVRLILTSVTSHRNSHTRRNHLGMHRADCVGGKEKYQEDGTSYQWPCIEMVVRKILEKFSAKTLFGERNRILKDKVYL